MKACKEFLAERGFKVKTVFRIPSKSEKGKFHIVELLENGTLRCDCIAGGKFKAFCSHKEKTAERLKEKGVFCKEGV